MDGDNNGYSWNHGVEGETTDPTILARREQEQRNFLTTLLLSQGVPMLLAGDEVGRTQQGNNNAYCQDNELSWFDWTLVEKNAALRRFVSGLIQLRRTTASLRRECFLTGHSETPGGLADAQWYGSDGESMDWSRPTGDLMLFLRAEPSRSQWDVPRHLLMILHQGNSPQYFTIPKRLREFQWYLFVDTSATPPNDFYAPPTWKCDPPRLRPSDADLDQAPPMTSTTIRVAPHTIVAFGASGTPYTTIATG